MVKAAVLYWEDAGAAGAADAICCCCCGHVSPYTRLPGSGKTTSQLAQEMISAGFKALVVCLDPKKLPASLAGRVWDQQLLSELPDGVDPCGEVRAFESICASSC